MSFNLAEYIKITNAKVLRSGNSDRNFSVSTDTRTISEKDIYLPLIGERFNGHDFIQSAISAGAKGYFTSDETLLFDEAEFIFYVPDTKIAYLQIASAYKKTLNAKTIAITGSSGKTTTKEMVASVLSQEFQTHKTAQNHNNEIGMAQTFLQAQKGVDVIVAEMGMRGLGEIDLLAKFALPDIGIITNIGTAHLGRLGSVENIAKAKCELTKYISNDGLLLIEDNEIADKFIEFEGEVKKIGLEKLMQNGELKILPSCDKKSKFIYKGFEYTLNAEGEHNILNSIFAIEAGKKLGMTEEKINRGLEVFQPVGNRWKEEKIKDFFVINDSYNANPNSMKCAIKTFLEGNEKPHVLVLGDMGELGEQAEFYHRQIGEFLNNYPAELLLTVGELAKSIAQSTNWKTKSFSSTKEVALFISENVEKNSHILLKASHSMKFEEIAEEMEK